MTGRPPTVSTKEVVQAIALHPEPVVTARDINEELNLKPDGARERLKRLAESGYLGSKQAGSSALVFWLTEKGKRELSNSD
jgi:predicted ArsR family transcriptional regulator